MANPLPGRAEPVLREPCLHSVFGTPVTSVPDGSQVATFALGCFWGAEKLFWELPGVTNTAVGYAGGATPNPSYEEVCSGGTRHAEAVRVCFDPASISYADLVRVFFENHDPTQGNRQGADIGTQYRSVLFVDDARRSVAQQVRDAFQAQLTKAGYGAITTEFAPADAPFYFAENYHQQYLAKNPAGYCPVHATGVRCG